MNYLAVALAVATFEVIRLRYMISNMKRSYAAMAAAALGPKVEVNGISLPPYDDDWRLGTGYRNKELTLGHIKIEHGGYIYIGDGAPFMDVTVATKDYCDQVWRAYRIKYAQKR